MPQYTYNHSDTNLEQHVFVDEHVLIPLLHWTSYYNFTNPLALPLLNTLKDIERNKIELFRLTTALTPRKFTQIGYKKFLKAFTASRAKDYSIKYYDHNLVRPNQDQFLEDDQFANPQLTEKLFIQTPYLFTLSILDKNTITSFQKHFLTSKLKEHFMKNLKPFQ